MFIKQFKRCKMTFTKLIIVCNSITLVFVEQYAEYYISRKVTIFMIMIGKICCPNNVTTAVDLVWGSTQTQSNVLMCTGMSRQEFPCLQINVKCHSI